jgi:hypothetical protein
MKATGVYELVGGPMDGGRVRERDGQIPRLIFVGRVVGADLFDWEEGGTIWHTCRYSQHDGRFHFAGYW